MIALARKYRPKLFADLIVQDHVAAALRGAVASSRVAHGYLFAGPRGVGKTTAARILAMALNCEQRKAGEGEPCGECESCRRVWTGQANLDVVELDAASNRGVDDARDLRERAMYAASAEGRHKVYIVDEAHMLTRDAWNALLKVLEEPPSGVVFVFATTEPQKIAQSAAPVLSRLQRFDFRRIGPHAIEERLRTVADAEKLEVDDDALRLIAKSADGGMRDGLSLLDQVLSFGEGKVTPERVRDVLGLIADDLYGEMLRLVAERDAKAVFPLVDRLAESGADFSEFIGGAGEILRAVLMAGLGGEPEGMTEAMLELVDKYRPVLPPEDIVRLLTVLGTMENQLRTTGHPRLVVELLLLRWALADRTIEISEVVKALGSQAWPVAGGQGPVSGGSGSPAPVLRDSTPGASPTTGHRPPATGSPATGSPERGPLTVARLQSLWPNIVAKARVSSPMVGSLLADATVQSVEATTVTVSAASAGTVEGLAHKKDTIAKVLSDWVDGAVQVAVQRTADPGSRAPGPRTAETPVPKVQRLTEKTANAERLKVLEAKDPTLGKAVDALDLELME